MKTIIFLILALVPIQTYTDNPIFSFSDLAPARYGMIPYLERLIWVESRGKETAVSHKNAKGVMQIMDSVLEDHNTFHDCGNKYTEEQLFDKSINTHIGVWQLKRLNKMFDGCDVRTVSAYNTGATWTQNGVLNFRYLFLVLGTNRTMAFVGDRKVRSFKGSINCYYVEGI